MPVNVEWLTLMLTGSEIAYLLSSSFLVNDVRYLPCPLCMTLERYSFHIPNRVTPANWNIQLQTGHFCFSPKIRNWCLSAVPSYGAFWNRKYRVWHAPPSAELLNYCQDYTPSNASVILVKLGNLHGVTWITAEFYFSHMAVQVFPLILIMSFFNSRNVRT